MDVAFTDPRDGILGIFDENDWKNEPKGAFRSRLPILGQAPRHLLARPADQG